MNKNHSYVLLANNANAAIFVWNKDKEMYAHCKTFEQDENQTKESNMFTDRAGTGATSFTADQTTMGESNYKNELSSKFSKKIDNYLLDEKRAGRLKRLIIISEPSFLGKLRTKMNTELREVTLNEIDKNFYTESANELENFMLSHGLI